MTVRFCFGLAALLVAGTAPTASAQAYLKAFGGGSWQENIESNGAVQLYEEFDTGGLVGGGVGYDFGQSRVEFEYAYRGDNNIESLAVNGNLMPVTGDIESHAFMFNFLREVDLGRAITPYVGAGIGVANVDHNIFYNNPAGRDFSIEDDSTTFAYQFMVGANAQLTQRAEMFLEYRYFGTAGFDIDRNLGAVAAVVGPPAVAAIPASTQVLDSEYDSHGLVFGITFKR